MYDEARSDLFSAEQEDNSGSVARGLGDNLVVTAGELESYGPIHERLHHGEDNIIRASHLLDAPELIRPIPVVDVDDRLLAVDSTALIEAARQRDPNFRLPVRLVAEQEAWAIRHEHHRKQFEKEPMALARRAWLMTQSSLNQEQVAQIIGCNPSRISQLVAAAKQEDQFSELKTVIIEPERIAISFWEEVHATIQALAANDKAKPIEDGPSRIERFAARARALVVRGQMLSVEAVRGELNLVKLRTPKARRARKIGKPVPVPGTAAQIFVARDRAGGAVLNLPQDIDQAIVDAAIRAVLEVLAGTAGKAALGHSQN